MSSPSANIPRVRFRLAPTLFLQVLRLSSLHKKQHLQIPIWPGERILSDPNNAHLWINPTGMPTSMAIRLSFSLSGIDPNAPTTTGITFVLATHIFRTSLARSWYFSTFSSSFSLTLPFSGIGASIIWQPLSLLSMITKSRLLDPIRDTLWIPVARISDKRS